MTHAIVVGAGVFGASTARELERRGWSVTVLEQYGPGNVRSGSGGETRIVRCAHGDADWYTLSSRRALELWQQLEVETGERLFAPLGVAWFDSGDGDFTLRSEQALTRLAIPCERLSPADALRLFPSIGGDDLRSVLFEPTAGVIQARAATRALARGLDVRIEHARPDEPPEADVVVWACGSWLPKSFPELVEQRVSRRDVFFFGVDARWANVPAFCDYDSPHYGHGDLDGLGLKVAPDTPGDEVDPDSLERLTLPESERLARAYLARRFPALAGAPVVGSSVCQYDLTADTHFLVARHPERSSWWLVGGGSGHGFKHGPALGEYVADCVEGRREPEPFHGLGPRSGQAGLRTATVEFT
jgi:sarcosine oxidase